MLAAHTGMKVYRANEIPRADQQEEILFLGWMKVGMIQGLNKVRKLNVKAVCGSGTGRTAEPDVATIIARNKLDQIPFFYCRGGCLPLKALKGMDRIMMSLFVKALKKRKDKDEKLDEAIWIIENGFDGVKEENLVPVIQWLNHGKLSGPGRAGGDQPTELA